MSLTITEGLMRSSRTDHTAERSGVDWYVTWLPGRPLDRNQAVSAMTLAELIESGTAEGSKDCLVAKAFAVELGLNYQEAVGLVLKTKP